MKILTLSTLVSIFLFSCTPYAGRPIVYEPQTAVSVFPFYVDGNPVSAVVTDNSIFQSSLDYSHVANRHYMRLWVSYSNFSNEPILFNPMESFNLTQYYLTNDKKLTHTPLFPSMINTLVLKDKQAAMVANAFIGIAEAASTTPTTYTSSKGVTIQANDLQEKLDTVNKNNADRVQNIVNSYEYYMKSINSILLKKNTVFPSQAVSGFVYFEIIGDSNSKYYARDYKYILQSIFSDRAITIEFIPVEGY